MPNKNTFCIKPIIQLINRYNETKSEPDYKLWAKSAY